MKPPVEQNAEEAWIDVTIRCTGFVCPGGNVARPAASVGSGTILRTTAGHVFCLTARHLIEEARGGQLWFGYHGCQNAIKTGIAAALIHPDSDTDLAILVLKRSDQARLAGISRESRDIASRSDLEGEDSLAICGHPAALAKLDLTASRQDFTSFFYGCTAADPQYDPKGRLRLSWGKEERACGMAMPPPAPGMSGGGLWRHRHVDQPVWTITASTKLIGVQSAWEELNGIAIVEPVERWLEWYAEKIEKLDADEFASLEAS